MTPSAKSGKSSYVTRHERHLSLESQWRVELISLCFLISNVSRFQNSKVKEKLKHFVLQTFPDAVKGKNGDRVILHTIPPAITSERLQRL